MKHLILSILLVIPAVIFTQEWKTITKEDMGDISMSYSRYIKINESDNSVWFGGDPMIFKLHNGIIEININYPLDLGESLHDVRDIIFYEDNVWLLDYEDGLFTFDGTSVSFMAPFQLGRTMTIDNQDSLLVGTDADFDDGYFAYKDGGAIMHGDWEGFLDNGTYQVFEDSYNRKWISYWNVFTTGVELGTGAGYSHYVDGTWGNYSPFSNNIPTYHVKKFVESPVNTIWAATMAGLCRYDEVDKDWIVYDKSNSNMPSTAIWDVKFDESGRTWAMFRDTAIGYTYNFTDWVIFDESNSPLTNEEIVAFDIDTLGNVWVLGDNEIHVLTLDEFEGWLDIDYNRTDDLTLFPNPANQTIYLKGELPAQHELFIYDQVGRLVLQTENSNGQVDITELQTGLYQLVVNSKNGVQNVTFLKK